MNRLTTDAPETATQLALNFFYAKDGEAMTRYPDENGQPISLFRFIRKAAKTLEGVTSWGFDTIVETNSDEQLNDTMYDNLTDGIETPEGVLAYLYVAVWVAAELRERLKKYEDAESAAET